MYKFLVLSESDNAMHGRAYESFVSAYCLARMGHEVIFLSDRLGDYVSEFYEGKRYPIEDMLNPQIAKIPATLPPSLMCIRMKGGEFVRDIIDAYGGGVDFVCSSGCSYMGSLAIQIAKSLGTRYWNIDDSRLRPCVNEIQYKHAKERAGITKHHVSVSDIITDHDIDILGNLSDICPEIKAVGQYKGDRESFPENVQILPAMSDFGRLSLLLTATLFIHPYRTSNTNYLAEAAVCGVPIIATVENRYDGILCPFLDFAVGYWKDAARYVLFETPEDKADRFPEIEFGFGQRMAMLHERICDIVYERD